MEFISRVCAVESEAAEGESESKTLINFLSRSPTFAI